MRNKAKLIETILADAKIDGKYYEPETGNTCVIGGLAQSAGLDMREWYIEYSHNNYMYVNYLYPTSPLITSIIREYGLTVEQMNTLQMINDAYHNTIAFAPEENNRRIEERHSSLVAQVNTWEEREEIE